MIKDFLQKHAAGTPVPFHMPGHKGKEIFLRYGYGDMLENLMDMDITEIAGAGNLFCPGGIIGDVEDAYARLYGVKSSYLLVNGSSCGIIAAVTASVKRGGRLILARNCHKAVFNAMTMWDIEPVYAAPDADGTVSREEIARCLKEAPDAEAVILASPSYYGNCSDICAIADEVHEKGKILIVDQAHGAHLKFFEDYCPGRGMPPSAESSGADIVVNSIHKTLASLTQSALLNVNSGRVDKDVLEERLQMVQSTSPSYILMAFLDINREIIENHGKELFSSWADNLDSIYDRMGGIPGLEVLTAENHDRTKINIDMSAYGLCGRCLEHILIGKNIWPELYSGDMLMLMSGIGNIPEHFDRLFYALAAIASENKLVPKRENSVDDMPPYGKMYEIPREKVRIPLSGAAGHISAGTVVPYPPGIPCLCPGEEITEEMAEYIEGLIDSGEKVTGLGENMTVLCGIDKKEMYVRKGREEDIPYIAEIYEKARAYMKAEGNGTQWDGGYPPMLLIERDISSGVCHVVMAGDKVCGVFALMAGEDPTYAKIYDGNWLNDEEYITIHRIAGDGETKGVFATAVKYCKGISQNIRIDTHADNITMRTLLPKYGFKRCGRIHLENGSPREAYQWTSD